MVVVANPSAAAESISPLEGVEAVIATPPALAGNMAAAKLSRAMNDRNLILDPLIEIRYHK